MPRLEEACMIRSSARFPPTTFCEAINVIRCENHSALQIDAFSYLSINKRATSPSAPAVVS